jgi:hypothetical protein
VSIEKVGDGPLDMNTSPRFIEHYRTTKAGEVRYRWRIRDMENNVIVQGLTFHVLREGSVAELALITEFLDAHLAQRQKAALRGELE